MRTHLRSLLMIALALLAFMTVDAQPAGNLATPPPATNTWQNNGIISMNINQYNVPMISNLAVLGTTVMAYDNVGAGFQMDSRSAQGNAYNPTQAGDCAQNPSKLLALNTSWGGNGIGIPTSYGFQFRVQPRNYNQPGSTCPGSGALLPYEFDFGATLGDVAHFPKQGMIIDMTVTRLPNSQTLEKGISDFPAFFPLVNVFPFAYSSPDGINFHPYTGGTSTNDVRQWPYGINYYILGKAMEVCNAGQGLCLTLYSNQIVNMCFSHRQGARNNLTLMSMPMIGSGYINDFNPHTGVKIFAVGNQQTVISVIGSAKTSISNWGDL